MLDGYGLHQLTWDTCDERFGDVLVASPADAGGRGIPSLGKAFSEVILRTETS